MIGLTQTIRSLPPLDILIASSPLRLANGLRLSVALEAASPTPMGYPVSYSRAGPFHASLSGTSGRLGIDVESLDRVSANATDEDAWLSPAERASVRTSSSPILELACYWVLKEAFGKALGVGLALPLAELSFVGTGRAITLDGPAAPLDRARWTFALYRRDELIIGTACRAETQTETPFAPFGRNPPMSLVDR